MCKFIQRIFPFFLICSIGFAEEVEDIFTRASTLRSNASFGPAYLFDKEYSEAEVRLAMYAGVSNKGVPQEAIDQMKSSDPAVLKRALLVLRGYYDYQQLQGKEFDPPWRTLSIPMEVINNLVNSFEQIKFPQKSPIDNNTGLLLIMIAKDQTGQRPGWKAAIARAADDPEDFLRAVNMDRLALKEASSEDVKHLEQLYSLNGNVPRAAIFSGFIGVRSSERADQLLKKAYESLDPQAIEVLENLPLSELLKQMSSKGAEYFEKIILSNTAELNQISFFWNQELMSFSNSEFSHVKPLLKKIYANLDFVSTGLDIEHFLTKQLDESDLGYLAKFFLDQDTTQHIKGFALLSSVTVESERLLEALAKNHSDKIISIIDKDLESYSLVTKANALSFLGRANSGPDDKQSITLRTILSLGRDSVLESMIKFILGTYNSSFHTLNSLLSRYKNLNSEEELHLMVLLLNKPMNIGELQAKAALKLDDDVKSFFEWITGKLEKLKLQDLELVIQAMSSDVKNHFPAIQAWLENCSKATDSRAHVCRKALNEKPTSSISSFRDKLEDREVLDGLTGSSALETLKESLEIVQNTAQHSKEDVALAAVVVFKNKELLKINQQLKLRDDEVLAMARPLLKHIDVKVRSFAIRSLELISPKSLKEDSIILPQVNVCDKFCAGAQKLLNEIRRADDVLPSFMAPTSIFSSAVTKLKLLTLYRASKLCGQSDLKEYGQQLQSVVRALRDNSKVSGPSKFIYDQLKSSLQRAVDPSSGMPDSYDRTFLLQLFADLEKDKNIGDLSSLRKQVEASIVEELKYPKLIGMEGSRSNLYAYSTMLHAVRLNQLDSESQRQIRKRAEEIPIDLKNRPILLPYNPVKATALTQASTTERSAIARSIPFYTSLYQHSQNPEEKSRYRGILLQALNKYFYQYFDDLSAHLQRKGTHDGEDGIAPYYLYPSLFYTRYAFEALEQDSELAHEERKKLENVKLEAQRRVTGLLRESGDFALTGDDKNQVSSGYGGFYGADQSMGLMALSSFVDCSVQFRPKSTVPGHLNK